MTGARPGRGSRIQLWTGGVIVAVVVLTALVSLVWTPHDPTLVDPAHRLRPPGWPYLLGTDSMGIDIASRLMAGARICLLVGVVSVSLAALVGVPLGMLAGMRQGWLGRLVVRITDILYAFPALLLAILLAAAVGGSTTTGMVAIGIATIPVFTRISRAACLQVMEQDYVLAARGCGTTWTAIAVRHVWPNIAPLVGVQASVSFAMAILAEAALSYLGLATAITTPSWGRMLYEAQSKQLFSHPEQVVWPGLAIALAVLGFNLLGDGLRELLDPRLRELS